MEEKNKIQIIPLGGLGEIGKNMMLLEWEDGILVIDAGIMFPEEQMPGIDFLIPDFSYLIKNREKLKGIILTHGHEDHIGAMPYLLKEVRTPIFGTKLTLGFVRNRLEEHYLNYKPEFKEIVPRNTISFGKVKCEFFQVCHSVADCVGIAFYTPFGIIVHTGDFKIDFTPLYGNYFDFHKLAEYGEKGVILLMADSTNVENEGYTPSESKLSSSLKSTIITSKGKIMVATFASNIYRIQQVLEICQEAGKRVAVLGRSMEKNITLAKELGYLHFNERILIPPEMIRNTDRNKVVALTTGSQGEPMSALWRIAEGKNRYIEIEHGDTVILSSSVIPGNEKTVSRIINLLFRKGAMVFYEGFEDLHVSGHASQEELKLVMSIIRPEYFIPIHGEFRHLVHHSNLARQMGIKEEKILIAEDGDIISIDENGVTLDGKIPAGHIYIDGKSVGEIGGDVLKDRHRLSEGGIVIVVLPVTREDNGILQPEIFSRGFSERSVGEELFKKAKDIVFDIMKKSMEEKNFNWNNIKRKAQSELRALFLKEISRSPVIVPIIIEL